MIKYNIMLEFRNVSLNLKSIVDKYYNLYGEGSCQHSFAGSFCLQSKYKDSFCEKDNVLYICREGISDNNYKAFLFPMCDRDDKQLIKMAIDNVLEDAHRSGKKVIFNTITKTCKEILVSLYDEKFSISDCRDYYEYIFDISKIANLSGSLFQSKRNKINKLEKEHEGKINVTSITGTDNELLEKFYSEWLNEHGKGNDSIYENEMKEFRLAIDNFDSLKLVGIKIVIDGELAGFNFGSQINADTYDGMVQKGNLKYDGIYEMLNRESAKLWIDKFKYLNFEEDLGIDGLRKAKLLYQPDILLEKYIATEV